MRRLTLLPLAGAVLLAAGAACRAVLEPGSRVALGVTDIQAPATFEAGRPFTVTLTVVTGGCRSFVRFDASRTPDRLTLRAVGRDRSGPGVECPTDVRYEPRDYTAQPPFADSVVVVAEQPELILLSRVVRKR
jgi:hypothetical protein